METAGIELHDAVLVRQAAEAGSRVIGIVFLRPRDLQDRIKRIGALSQHTVGSVDLDGSGRPG